MCFSTYNPVYCGWSSVSYFLVHSWLKTLCSCGLDSCARQEVRTIGMTTLKATQRLPDESIAIEPLPSCEGVLATMSLLS